MKADEVKLLLRARPRLWNSWRITQVLRRRGVFREQLGRHEKQLQLRHRFSVSLGALYYATRFLWVGQMYEGSKDRIIHGMIGMNIVSISTRTQWVRQIQTTRTLLVADRQHAGQFRFDAGNPNWLDDIEGE